MQLVQEKIMRKLNRPVLAYNPENKQWKGNNKYRKNKGKAYMFLIVILKTGLGSHLKVFSKIYGERGVLLQKPVKKYSGYSLL